MANRKTVKPAPAQQKLSAEQALKKNAPAVRLLLQDRPENGCLVFAAKAVDVRKLRAAFRAVSIVVGTLELSEKLSVAQGVSRTFTNGQNLVSMGSKAEKEHLAQPPEKRMKHCFDFYVAGKKEDLKKLSDRLKKSGGMDIHSTSQRLGDETEKRFYALAF